MFKIMDMAIWPINKLINKTLALDTQSLDKLAPHAGKVLAIELSGIDQTLFAFIQVDGIRLSFNYSGEPTTTLIGTPLAFMRLLMQSQTNTISRDIKIKGDPHFAQHMQIILSGLDIDWEEHLSKFIGDNAAHQMGHFGKSIKQWLADTRSALRSDTKDYLQQETQQLPSRKEVDMFLHDVDELRNDIERLAVRIKKLN